MGGKLFHLPRMPRAEYLAREADMRAFLDERIPGRYRIPRHYGDKPDFGDMDVLVATSPAWDRLREAIPDELGITESKVVGHVLSTVWRGLQTDFFQVDPIHLDTTADYMSWNDLGNFIGRICRRFDLKYGEEGLSYVFRRGQDGAPSNYKKDLPVTRDFARTCAFLGLDHAAWVRGFASLPEMFAWVTASPYFSVVPYLDTPSGTVARRVEVRSTVARFVEWLRATDNAQRPTFLDRRAYRPMVAAAFPEAGLLEAIAAEEAEEARQLEIARKLNGKRIMDLVPSLSGKELGAFIVAFKRRIPDFDDWVAQSSEEHIDAEVRAFARSWRGGEEP